MSIAVHVTHESVKKIGGIGAVLSGVCNSSKYEGGYEKTVFYGPVFGEVTEVLVDLEKGGEVLYSSHDGFNAGDYREKFEEIIRKYNVDIIYGQRKLVSEFDATRYCVVDVINVGITRMNQEQSEQFKYLLWKEFDIKSHLYDDDWDYNQYLRIGAPYLEILDALYGSDAEYVHFSHEYMGVPSVLSVLLAKREERTVFIAHEVTTARSIVEGHNGHDISFYNILSKARGQKSLEQVFGSHENHSRTALVKCAKHFDYVFAVGDQVKDEYLFLVPDADPDKIKIVYNGVSAKAVTFEQKQESRKRIETYINRLYNFTPDVIFTHISRLVISKGIWRDIALLGYLDEIFSSEGLKGIYILLSTQVATGRAGSEVFKMERDYGWPVLHREGWPDLIGDEKDVYSYLQLFNARSRAIKGVFLNQFGFDRARCGLRMPADSEFMDLRMSSDAELGLSIYEPFGIAQIETVPFGGVAILSSCCGSAGFLVESFKGSTIKPYYIVDYTAAGKRLSYNSLKDMTIAHRSEMEEQILVRSAGDIFEVLPLTDEKRRQYLENALKYASKISWDSSAAGYVLSSDRPTLSARGVCPG